MAFCMKYLIPYICVALSLFLVSRSAVCEDGWSLDASNPWHGAYCPQTADTAVFHSLTRHQCVVTCMHRKCQAMSYNPTEKLCMLEQHPCPVIHFSAPFVFQVQRRVVLGVCTHWITHNSGPLPARTVQDTSGSDVQIAARFNYPNTILAGKYEPNAAKFRSVLNDAITEEDPSADLEYMVIDTACGCNWRTYNSLANGPLPVGTIEAGSKQDGTKLYMARIKIVNTTEEYSFGYYDPQTKYAYAYERGNVRKVTFMHLLGLAFWIRLLGNHSTSTDWRHVKSPLRCLRCLRWIWLRESTNLSATFTNAKLSPMDEDFNKCSFDSPYQLYYSQLYQFSLNT